MSRRVRARRAPRRTVLLVTNGRVTEQQYLTALRAHLSPENTTVKQLFQNGEPETVLRKLTRPHGDASEYDEVWFVLDEDGRDREAFLRAFSRAAPKGRQWHVVVSRPCFEVWLVAHYEQVRRYGDQAQAQAHLASVTSAPPSEKSLPPDLPLDAVDLACHRCRLMGVAAERLDEIPPTPGSGMHHLVRSLRAQG